MEGHLLGTFPDGVSIIVASLEQCLRLLLYLQGALVRLLQGSGMKEGLGTRGGERGPWNSPGVIWEGWSEVWLERCREVKEL